MIRQQQQGLGKSIIAAKYQGHQIVAVGDTIHYSTKWKTVPDFLADYIKLVLGEEWGNGELAKPLAEQHPILRWHGEYCRYQQQYAKAPGEIHSTPATGVVYCYMGLAYNLYLLKHNVELQQRFVERLKHVDQFQGAYYELIVANILIRAGFVLALEDETDESQKHCEFSAVSQVTGRKYWVEAKMRGVDGLLGRTALNGASAAGKDPTASLTNHLKSALMKPAVDGERLIFSDVNDASAVTGTEPRWVKQAIRRLEGKERNLLGGQRAYVFVTNFPFHCELGSAQARPAVLAYGLGMNDFGKLGQYRLSEMYRMKQRHIDAYNILESSLKYPHVPSNFDGKLSSEAFNTESQRIIIGETYFFNDVDDGLIGKVTTATVSETDKLTYIGVQTPDGKGVLLTRPMSEDELADYRDHPEAYFGVIQPVSKKAEDPYQLFEFFLGVYEKTPRERLLELFMDTPDIDSLRSLDSKDLLLECCERWVAATIASTNRQK